MVVNGVVEAEVLEGSWVHLGVVDMVVMSIVEAEVLEVLSQEFVSKKLSGGVDAVLKDTEWTRWSLLLKELLVENW